MIVQILPSYPVMIPPGEALRRVMDAVEPLAPRRVPLLAALGRTLAETIRPDRSYPPFRRAMMDGFAVRLAMAGEKVQIRGEQGAGRSTGAVVTEDGCVEVMTGAACPPGTEAVVQKEHVRREGDWVTFPPSLRAGQHIAEVGSECGAEETTLSFGTRITPLAIAMMATFGIHDVLVVPAPKAAVIATGEELVGEDQSPRTGEIRDSNGPMLTALALCFGLEMPLRRHVGDDRGAIRAVLEETADRDLVLLSGGVSAGNYDLVPDVLRNYGAEIVFHKVTQKPGKPLLFARRGEQVIFGLPGNPLACHFCFCRYAVAALGRMEARPAEPAVRWGQLDSAVPTKGLRTHFVPARAVPCGGEAGPWRLTPQSGVSSADIFHSHLANAYIELSPGIEAFAAGQTVPFTLIPNHG